MAKNKKDLFEEDIEKEEDVERKKVRRVFDDEDEEEYEELTTEERIVNIEKKVNQLFVIGIICVITSVLALIVILVNNGSGNTTTEETQQQESSAAETSYDTSMFKEIKGTDIATESKNETIVVMVGRQGCGYCAQFAPILAQVAEEYGVTVRYIDLAKMIQIGTGEVLDQDSINAFSKITGDGQWASFATDYFGRTPQTMFIKNNKVVYGLAGAADASTTRSVFETVGFKKK